MANLGVVFLTGLTTGGLSCLAVQGGLLASSVAHQAEKDVQKELLAQPTPQNTTRNRRKKRKQARNVTPTPVVVTEQPKRNLTRPIVLFLGSKLIAYTLLGFLLGWIGAMLQLTPYMRALLQLAIGIFMVGTALRMFNVHPIFRYFVIEPPSFLTRYIRRKAKTSTDDVITPTFLGALTVLIPCGVTQAMMALAIGTGSPASGAAIMFAFTLGTSPVFFTLAYLATRLGERLQARFLKVVAVTVLILGLIAVDSGLNLIGSRLSAASMIEAIWPVTSAQTQYVAEAPKTTAAPEQAAPQVAEAPKTTTAPEQAAPVGVVTINALDYGYAPSVVRAKAGQPVELNVVTNNTYGCTRAFVIPSLNIQHILPASGTTTINLPAQQGGTLRFTCSMGMYGGQIQFE
jgi:sulfite exporter TauE/SafE